MIDLQHVVVRNLSIVVDELARQPDIGAQFRPDELGYFDQVDQLREWIDVNEYGLAYEVIVALLESYAFRLSGSAAVRLLEVGLLMKYKSDLPKDVDFDSRTP